MSNVINKKTILFLAAVLLLCLIGLMVFSNRNRQEIIPDDVVDIMFVLDGKLDKDVIMREYAENEEDTAQELAELYVYAIQHELDTVIGLNTVDMFEKIFDISTLVVTEVSLSNIMPSVYMCDIIGSGPKGERRVPLYLVFQEDNPRYRCILSDYGEQSLISVETYLDYLLRGYERELSRWLSIDGGEELFLKEAIHLIEQYKMYDLTNTTIIGFDYDMEMFVYTIQDAKGEIFTIYMVNSDGHSMPLINSFSGH